MRGKYHEEMDEQAFKLCLLGATDKEMADFFNVAVSNFYDWKKKHANFADAIKRGKTMADANVAQRLYERAMGYEHDDVYPSSYQGKVTLTPIKRYYPPDTQAASLWLRNRQTRQWRDKREFTGADDGPITVIERVIVDTKNKDG